MSDKKANPDTDTAAKSASLMSRAAVSSIGLVVEPESSTEADQFARELEKTLQETEQAVLALGGEQDQLVAQSWQKSRQLVADFRPVPWFIWRLSNFVLGAPGHISKASEGLVFGLRRLLFAAASDSIIGAGQKVNNVHQALDILKPDVVAAVAVIHAICRRLATKDFERIWKPILDDALLRAQLGYHVGKQNPNFGCGRGMLAGFAGRCGLAILIASGELEQARKALEFLATGAEIKEVGLNIYGCDPLQVSAMTLSACGCGRDSAFGTVAFYSTSKAQGLQLSSPQQHWKAAFAVTELIRTNKLSEVDQETWEVLNFQGQEAKDELSRLAKIAVRRGHGWAWLIGGTASSGA